MLRRRRGRARKHQQEGAAAGRGEVHGGARGAERRIREHGRRPLAEQRRQGRGAERAAPPRRQQLADVEAVDAQLCARGPHPHQVALRQRQGRAVRARWWWW